MKFPNFKLHETQARASILFGALGLLSLCALCVVVFKGLDSELMVVHYNTKSTLGRFRKMIVFGGAALTFGLALIAGLLGFNSLGQKRNKKQGNSWLGMFMGALAAALAPVLLFAWTQLQQPVISGD